jgi:hypothetical protein
MNYSELLLFKKVRFVKASHTDIDMYVYIHTVIHNIFLFTTNIYNQFLHAFFIANE